MMKPILSRLLVPFLMRISTTIIGQKYFPPLALSENE